jgi:hypothetical protein
LGSIGNLTDRRSSDDDQDVKGSSMEVMAPAVADVRSYPAIMVEDSVPLITSTGDEMYGRQNARPALKLVAEAEVEVPAVEDDDEPLAGGFVALPPWDDTLTLSLTEVQRSVWREVVFRTPQPIVDAVAGVKYMGHSYTLSAGEGGHGTTRVRFTTSVWQSVSEHTTELSK